MTVEAGSTDFFSTGANSGEDATLGAAISAAGADCKETAGARGAGGAGALGISGVTLRGAGGAAITGVTATAGGTTGFAAKGGATGVTLDAAGTDPGAAGRVAPCGRIVSAGNRIPQNPGAGSVNRNST